MHDKWSLMSLALQSRPNGYVCEFGVYTGESIRFIAERAPEVHGFDSFEGLPEKWRDGFEAGMFRTSPPTVPPNVHLHVGLFERTIPRWLEQFSGPVGFVHIDCDLYSSALTALCLLGDRLAPRAVLLFDELVGYPGWLAGEFQALAVWLRNRGRQVEPIGYVEGGQQAALAVIP